MWVYRAKTPDLPWDQEGDFSSSVAFSKKTLGRMWSFEGLNQLHPELQTISRHSAGCTGNGQSAPWVVSRRSCSWWELLAAGRGSVAPLLLLLLSPVGTCRTEIPQCLQQWMLWKGPRTKHCPSVVTLSLTPCSESCCAVLSLEHAKQVWKKELIFSPIFSHQRNHTFCK